MSDPTVTMRHVRACKLCVRGAKDWFLQHGLDFRHFMLRGYPASVIEATGDHLGKLVATKARESQQ